MFPEVHDSEIVAYSVDSRTSELVLVLAPGNGSATEEFQLLFRGVVAHQFEYPLIPSIVLDLVETSAFSLLEKEWPNLSEGRRQCGWPGSWARSIEEASTFCGSSGVKGFEIESSYGLSGWILACSVEVISAPGTCA